MYKIIPQKIPQGRRAEINEKILYCIDTNSDQIPKQTIYNCYTGIGGLHNLKQEDYANYNLYSEAKKEIEKGQFFTPHYICHQMVDAISPESTDMVLDMCCGMGNLLGRLPNEYNAYGFDIDRNAVKVAKHLYPNANIGVADICDYDPEQKFDIVIGNPPFNLKFNGTLSQFYYCNKAYWMLNPTGLMMIIVPTSFLNSEFWERSKVNSLNQDFSFIGQTKLDPKAFESVGVSNFETKIMVFMRRSENITMQPYIADEFVYMDELQSRITTAKALRQSLKLKLMQESCEEVQSQERSFNYTLKKYMYEIKTHKNLKKHYDKSVALVAKFRNQKRPDNCTEEQRKEWDKRKLIYAKVLSVLHRYIKRQDIVPRKEVALVRTRYGFKLKGYAPRLLDGVEHRYASLNNILIGACGLPSPKEMTPKLQKQYSQAQKYIAKRCSRYSLQSLPFSDMERDIVIDKRIKELRFFNKEMQSCTFTELQQHDMGLIFQKRYSFLNWQQGSGKTAVAYHYGKYLMEQKRVKSVVVLAPAIAVSLTWIPFLKRHNSELVCITKPSQLQNIPNGKFVIVAISRLNKLDVQLKKFLKMRSQKVCLLFDESDEITNPTSKRTKLSLGIFRRVKYKLLATGTAVRNNITEIYSQLELLYNNSVNMTSFCDFVYVENKEKEIDRKPNPYFREPFPARYGANLFKGCFCPSKASVFGIGKQNQDIYNQEHLAQIVNKTLITRKFKEFAGEKYEVINRNVTPSEGEREVYRTIMEEFQTIIHNHFSRMDDSKKESQLRLIRQITLLIKACSIPHMIEGYYGEKHPRKVKYIEHMIRHEIAGKVAIGCTSLVAVAMYTEYMSAVFPDRELFTIQGDVNFDARQRILDKFEATTNGILVCTQQSLKSSANVPSCEDIILESLQWNIAKMEQFYFRFIRLDSQGMRRVHFVSYEESIEQNLMALILTKERLNEFIKDGTVKTESEIFEEFDVSPNVIESLFRREADDNGNFQVRWGKQQIG